LVTACYCYNWEITLIGKGNIMLKFIACVQFNVFSSFLFTFQLGIIDYWYCWRQSEKACYILKRSCKCISSKHLWLSYSWLQLGLFPLCLINLVLFSTLALLLTVWSSVLYYVRMLLSSLLLLSLSLLWQKKYVYL
jgi:hypothetical protein